MLASYITEQSLSEALNLPRIDKIVRSTVREAFLRFRNKRRAYIFMHGLVQFNRFAASSVMILSGHITQSQGLFRDPNATVPLESDRAFEVARGVYQASCDEILGTHGNGITHRTAALALLKSVGDYAGLSDAERRILSLIPYRLQTINKEMVHDYCGKAGDIRALMIAIGYHVASEFLADREFSIIERIVRREGKNRGFDGFLQRERGLNFYGTRIDRIWGWVSDHGSAEASGVEQDHFRHALNAANMAVAYGKSRDIPAEQLLEWIHQGIRRFADLEQLFFLYTEEQCKVASGMKIPAVASRSLSTSDSLARLRAASALATAFITPDLLELPVQARKRAELRLCARNKKPAARQDL